MIKSTLIFNKLFINNHSIRYLQHYERTIPKTLDEYRKFQFKKINTNNDEQEEANSYNQRSLRIAIVGCPNAGKSTLLNQLINWKISAVSSKVHTTKNNIMGVYNENDVQLEFIDTPGLVSHKHMIKHKLNLSFINDLRMSIKNIDNLTIIVDVSNKREKSRLNRGIIELLQKFHSENVSKNKKQSILVLNKIDKLRDKRSMLEIISTLTNGVVNNKSIVNHESIDQNLLNAEIKQGNFSSLFERTKKHYKQYNDQIDSATDSSSLLLDNQNYNGTGWPNFSQIFMISALNNDGIDKLRNYYIENAKPNQWAYNENVVTIENPKHLIINTIREICLELFRQEIPYNFYYNIVMWEKDDLDNLYLVIEIICPKKFLTLLIGRNGSNISEIVRKSRLQLSNIFHCDISLKVIAKSF